MMHFFYVHSKRSDKGFPPSGQAGKSWVAALVSGSVRQMGWDIRTELVFERLPGAQTAESPRLMVSLAS